MTEYKISIKKTVELSNEELFELIQLKQQYWPHNEEQQMEWIHNNIKSHDYHILIRDSNNLLAYLDMVNIMVEFDHKRAKMFGIGNVCVDKKHTKTGMGSMLIGVTNCFLKQKKMCGILLCKDHVVGFYKRNQWDLIVSEKVKVNDTEFCHYIMAYDPFKLYFNEAVGEIYIDRVF